MTEHERDAMQPEFFTRGLGKEIRREVRSWLRWAVRAAAVGASALGGAGLRYFGLTGVGIGGLGAMLLHGDASTGF